MTPSNLNSIPLVVTAYLAVFVASYPHGPRGAFGVQLDLLPPLMVYCGLNSTWGTVGGIAIFGGLLFDSLSANPLGITTLALFAVGIAIRWNKDAILRDQCFAQFVLGIMAGLAAPAVTLLLLWTFGKSPLFGLGTIWHIGTSAAVGGLATPLLFWLLDRIKAAFDYRPLPESSFRSDREIKRGRF